MNEIVITSPETLKEIISQALRNELESHFQKHSRKNENAEEFLNFKQVLLMLKISRPTLFKRMKEGKIPFTRIGRRLLFPREEIVNSVKMISKLR